MPSEISSPRRIGAGFCGAVALAALAACAGTASVTPGETTTPARKPVAAESNESTNQQLAYARAEGQTVEAAWQWLKGHAAAAGDANAGEYTIGYAVSAPEGWYEGAGAAWHAAPAAGAHLQIVVRDGGDGRLVPQVVVRATLRDAAGKEVLSRTLPFGWYPLLNGYGDNVAIAGPRPFTLDVEIAPPDYRRHDPYNGDRFTLPTRVRFEGLAWPSSGAASAPLSEQRLDEQAALAKAQGAAYGRTMTEAMFTQAVDGKTVEAPPYQVACAIEYSEGYWHYHDGKFAYFLRAEESAERNAHVEIAPRDQATGRFISDLKVAATVLEEKGTPLGTQAEPLMWHPWLYHYGENWRVPRSAKTYRVKAHFDAPAFRRYGKQGAAIGPAGNVEFTGVTMKTGQK